MFSPSRKLMVVIILCLALFAAGLIKLFLLRFESGDVYPAYSSLRTDPLGTRALFESLKRLSPDSAQRNYYPLNRIDMEADDTLLVTGLRPGGYFFRKGNLEHLLENLSRSGGRMVLTFSHLSYDRIDNDDGDARREDKSKTEKKDPKGKEETAKKSAGEKKNEKMGPEYNFFYLPFGMESLGFRFNHMKKEEPGEVATRYSKGLKDILPATIPWHSSVYFQLRDNSWEVIYKWEGKPVVVSRPWGKGTIVMAADSYLFSNEALRNHRYPRFLTWMLSPGNDVVFDESSKGLVEQPGAAGLARKYRLHGVLAALLLVAVLFLWRQSVIFVPNIEERKGPSDDSPALGRDTDQGMVHLTRQHIGARYLLTVCFEAWKSQAAKRMPSALVTQVSDKVHQAAKNPQKEIQVQTYKEICELLKQGK